MYKCMTLGYYLQKKDGVLSEKETITLAKKLLNRLESMEGFVGISLAACIQPDNVILYGEDVYVVVEPNLRVGAQSAMLAESYTIYPGYAAPELYCQDKTIGVFTEVYAVGALLYRCLIGRPPMEGYKRTIKDYFVAPHKLRKEISKKLSDIIVRALQPEIENRYSWRWMMLQDLNALIGNENAESKASRELICMPDSLPAGYMLSLGLEEGKILITDTLKFNQDVFLYEAQNFLGETIYLEEYFPKTCDACRDVDMKIDISRQVAGLADLSVENIVQYTRKRYTEYYRGHAEFLMYRCQSDKQGTIFFANNTVYYLLNQ